MPFARLKRTFGTLRVRLMAWNTAVVLLMVIPTLVIVREGLRHTLMHEFDRLLVEDTLEIRLSIKTLYPHYGLDPVQRQLTRKARGHAKHGWFAELFDGDGNLIWASWFVQVIEPNGKPRWERNSVPPLELPPPSQQKHFREDVASFRLVQARLDEPGIPPLIVRVGSSLEGIQDDLQLLTQMMVLAGALILLIAPLGGYWLAGRATQPLARIIHTTAGLRPSKLDERLPIRQTGDELDQLSQTINGLLDRLAAYLDQNRDFLANAAHELRSPLAAIRSSVEVALNGARSPEEYTNLLADILEECSGLQTLVNRILLLAEGDAGTLAQPGQWVNLDRVVGKAVDMFAGVADASGIALTVASQDGVCVPGDDYHLRQVINNLLDNALKFTPAGGQVHVDVAADAAAGRALLRVMDTGMGISNEDLPRIFERFYRSDKSRHREARRDGTGLGLSICETIVHALRGSITVESTLGQGTTFTIRLPLQPQEAGGHTAVALPARG